jgi:hypothetical protein
MIGATRMQDDEIAAALAAYRAVRASDQLRAAVTRSPAPARGRRRPRIVIGGVAAAVVAVVAVVLATDRPDPTGVDTGNRRLDLDDAQTVVFSDGTRVRSDELFDAANHERLQALFAAHGAELVLIERPVAPAADGRVFTVTVPPGMADDTEPGLIDLEEGGRVEVEVGRADPTAGTAGLTLHEVFPALPSAIDRDDPVATEQALEQLGFGVRWVLIEAPGRGRDVDAPPPGTVVISVLGPRGEWTDIEPTADTLMVEVAAPAVAEQLDH